MRPGDTVCLLERECRHCDCQHKHAHVEAATRDGPQLTAPAINPHTLIGADTARTNASTPQSCNSTCLLLHLLCAVTTSWQTMTNPRRRVNTSTAYTRGSKLHSSCCPNKAQLLTHTPLQRMQHLWHRMGASQQSCMLYAQWPLSCCARPCQHKAATRAPQHAQDQTGTHRCLAHWRPWCRAVLEMVCGTLVIGPTPLYRPTCCPVPWDKGVLQPVPAAMVGVACALTPVGLFSGQAHTAQHSTAQHTTHSGGT